MDLNGPWLQILQSSSCLALLPVYSVQYVWSAHRPNCRFGEKRRSGLVFPAKRIQFLCFPPTRIQKFLVCLVYGLQKLGFETMWDLLNTRGKWNFVSQISSVSRGAKCPTMRSLASYGCRCWEHCSSRALFQRFWSADCSPEKLIIHIHKMGLAYFSYIWLYDTTDVSYDIYIDIYIIYIYI